MKVRQFTRNGQVWEARLPRLVTRYAGEPCTQIDMRGDAEEFFGEGAIIIEVLDLGDGWTRYWLTSTSPVLRANTRKLVEAYERDARPRGVTMEQVQLDLYS